MAANLVSSWNSGPNVDRMWIEYHFRMKWWKRRNAGKHEWVIA